jgi:ABC-type lipoprotein export system ATPase subunit
LQIGLTERGSPHPLPQLQIRSSVILCVLELRNIRFRNLKDFNYSHRSGEKALILGVSGCGKSSLL